ncbi:hypothetical protein HanPI659440_Chr13g0510921 [Helianthus annuus]|nr:hypothetical protein HanPI659440_Chr13g0510921 [Helianthus annuus]
MIRLGQFGSDETIRCCHDCLSALSTAGTAGIRHGDIRPEKAKTVRLLRCIHSRTIGVCIYIYTQPSECKTTNRKC